MLIYGWHAVNSALDNYKSINKVWINKELDKKNLILNKCKNLNIPIALVDNNKLESLLYKHFNKKLVHQGIVADISPFSYSNIDDILKTAQELNEDPFIILLDSIEDPVNLGSIIRISVAAGVHGIIIPKNRACQITDTVYKVSAGAINFIKIARVTNLVNTINELKQKGLWIVGTDINSNKIYYELDLKGPLGLIIGNEGKGLRELVKKSCDYIIKIPITSKIDSLNAAISTGILVYEILRQRQLSVLNN